MKSTIHYELHQPVEGGRPKPYEYWQSRSQLVRLERMTPHEIEEFATKHKLTGIIVRVETNYEDFKEI